MNSRILKADEDQHLIFGIVYAADDEMVREWMQKGATPGEAPSVVDSQEEFVSEATLDRTYQKFMKHYHETLVTKGVAAAGYEHSKLANGVVLMQSAILPKGTHWPDADSPELPFAKNWVRCDYVEDPVLWEKVKQGQICGYSVGGYGQSGRPR